MRSPLAVVVCAGLVFTACGGGGQKTASCTKAVSGSTAHFTYRVDPAGPGRASDRLAPTTAAAVCERLRAVKADHVQVRPLGGRRIRVTARDDQRSLAAVDFATRRVSFQFYDWEPNVLGKRGPDAPFSGPRALYDATVLASRSKPKAEASDVPPAGPSKDVVQRFGGDDKKVDAYYDRGNDTGTTRYYLFGPDHRPLGSNGKPLPPGSSPRLAASPSAPSPSLVPAGGVVVKVPQGIVVVQAEAQANQPETVQRFFALEDDSELSGSDIENPKQSLDPRTNQPVITMQFTDTGRRAFARATKREAERGSRIILPPGTPKQQAFQRFALTVDGEILSLATIDFVENPEGIDGRTGAQIEGSGGVYKNQLLAVALKIGALPAELTLVSKD